MGPLIQRNAKRLDLLYRLPTKLFECHNPTLWFQKNKSIEPVTIITQCPILGHGLSRYFIRNTLEVLALNLELTRRHHVAQFKI